MVYVFGNDIDEEAIRYMVAYCTTEQFVSAIRGDPYLKEDFIRLAKAVDDAWDTGFELAIRDELEE
jgi:hypothetical protein